MVKRKVAVSLYTPNSFCAYASNWRSPGGSVHALVKMESNELLLEVSDTGQGIHPDDLPHVFDRYFQTNRPDAPAIGGTGIGLALCQEYSRLFGGSITVESKTSPSGGTEAKDKLKALRIGVDDYLTKPFDEEELLVRIENLLANRAAKKEAVAGEPTGAGAPEMSLPEQEWLEKFEAYVQANLANDARSISFLAQEFAMSESTLYRQVIRLTGLSPKQYLQEVRLDTARQLLENQTYRSVPQVATAAGFGNARTFARSFRERFGKLPSEYLNG